MYKICVGISFLFIIIGVFVKLYTLIDDSMISSYQKTRCDMLMFFIGMFFCLAYKIFVGFDHVWIVDLESTIENLIKTCDNPSFMFKISKYLHVILAHCQVLNLILAFLMIKVKSTNDILQEFSKVTHLLKASIFQRYKGANTSSEQKAFEKLQNTVWAEVMNSSSN